MRYEGPREPYDVVKPLRTNPNDRSYNYVVDNQKGENSLNIFYRLEAVL